MPSQFWKSFQKGFSGQVKLSTSFHPQGDGQAVCTNQTLEDMLRSYVIDFKGNWDDNLSLIEFSYNNSYHSGISMAPFEALYGRRCRSPVGWLEVGESSLHGTEIIYEAIEKVRTIKDILKKSYSRCKSYAFILYSCAYTKCLCMCLLEMFMFCCYLEKNNTIVTS